MMRLREQHFRPRPDYLDWHTQINRRMRAVLFDWMVEVGQEYVLKRQTIHMAFFFVDRYLSSVTEVPRCMLQLVGVVALYLASKSEEIFPPRCQDFQLTTDGAYQIHEMKALLPSRSPPLLFGTRMRPPHPMARCRRRARPL